MYGVVVEDAFGISRDELRRRLARRGIETRTFFIPIHLQPIYYELFRGQRFPVAEELCQRGLYLPSGATLTEAEIAYVCDVVAEVREERRMIPVFAPWLSENVRRYVLDCVDSGWISSLGEYVRRFERDFAAFCEARHAVATSNGTTALHLCLATLGIGPGRRGPGPGPDLRLDRQRRPLHGRDAGAGRRRPAHLGHGPGRRAPQAHGADPGHHPGPPLRAPGRPGPPARPGRRARAGRRRGRRRGARRALQGAAGRRARPHRRLLVLRQQDHHDRRGRHGRDERPGAGRAGGVPARPRHGSPSAATTTRRSASTTA